MKHGYQGFYNRYTKRVLDFIVAFVLFILLLPVFFIIAAAILLEDGWPIFYRPLRGGYHNRPFRIFKFRTMVKNADQIGGGTTALHDPRITRVGQFLRKTKLDETANLLNILTGSMSFIGPRPELLKYIELYGENERIILEVRPGLSDYSSLEFINLDEIVGTENPDEMYEKLVLTRKNELRVKYAENVSLSTDVGIFFRTVWMVLKKAFDFTFRHKHR